MTAEKHNIMANDRMVSALHTPWHGLGTIADRLLSPEEAFEIVGQSWTVGKHPAFTRTTDGTFKEVLGELVVANALNPTMSFGELLQEIGFDLPIEDKFATVREDIALPFNVVGKDYTTFQNEQAYEIIKAVGMPIETAGSVKNGRKCWALAKMDRTLDLAGDEVLPYLLYLWSHDGSTAVRVIPTPIRVVCDNTIRMAVRNAINAWSAAHTSSIHARADEAKRTMRESRSFYDNFEVEVRKLIDLTVAELDFERILQEVVPDPQVTAGTKVSNRKLDNAIEKRGEIRNLYRNDPRVAEFNGTGWGVVQAFSTHDLWFGRVQGETKGGDTVRLQRQASRILSGETLANTARVQELVMALGA